MDRCREGRQNAQVQSHVAVVVSGNNGMPVPQCVHSSATADTNIR